MIKTWATLNYQTFLIMIFLNEIMIFLSHVYFSCIFLVFRFIILVFQSLPSWNSVPFLLLLFFTATHFFYANSSTLFFTLGKIFIRNWSRLNSYINMSAKLKHKLYHKQMSCIMIDSSFIWLIDPSPFRE